MFSALDPGEDFEVTTASEQLYSQESEVALIGPRTSPLAGTALETIKVYYEQLGNFGGNSYYHETLVYTNSSGQDSLQRRGRPSEQLPRLQQQLWKRLVPPTLEGRWQGDIVVDQHRYYPQGGSHDDLWLYEPSGRQVGLVREGEDAAGLCTALET
jgi:hypothetical protein